MGLDTVELLMKVEQHFSICVPDAEAEKVTTVQDYYDLVARHLQATPGQKPVIEAAVNRIIAEHAGIELAEIQPHKSITNDLGLD